MAGAEVSVVHSGFNGELSRPEKRNQAVERRFKNRLPLFTLEALSAIEYHGEPEDVTEDKKPMKRVAIMPVDALGNEHTKVCTFEE